MSRHCGKRLGLALLIVAFSQTSTLAQAPLSGAAAIQTPAQPSAIITAQAPATQEIAIMEAATQVLDQVMAIPAKAIPRSMLSGAEGIAIIPGMIKGGFVVGVRHGRGVVVTRTAEGSWTAPTFITATGGSVGWQAGLQSTDVILVFRSKRGVQGLMSGKFTIGADASAAAGPVGREASIGTDGRLSAEIYSYSRSRGLFAGVAIDGSVISIDGAANNQFYQAQNAAAAATGQPQQLPPSAATLLATVMKYTEPAAGQPTPAEATQPVTPLAEAESEQRILDQLVSSTNSMNRILDSDWRAYLALPADYLQGNFPANPPSLDKVVARYEAVAADPQYRALATRAEFQQTFGLLKSLASMRNAAALSLPPPPQ